MIDGVADRAVAERGQLPAAVDGRCRKHRRIRPRDRRDRSPRQHGRGDADAAGDKRGDGREARRAAVRMDFASGPVEAGGLGPLTGARRGATVCSPRNPARMRSGVNGSSRKRTPVASKMALAIAAALGTEADSPTPSGG